MIKEILRTILIVLCVAVVIAGGFLIYNAILIRKSNQIYLEKSTELDEVVAVVGDKGVSMLDYLTAYGNALRKYGITNEMLDNEKYAEQISELQKATLEDLAKDLVMNIALEDLGYLNLSSDDQSIAETKAQQEIDNYLELYNNDINDALGENYTEKEYETIVNEYTQLMLSSWGLSSYDELVDFFGEQIAIDNAKEDYIDASKTPSEEYLEKVYNDYLLQNIVSFDNNPAQYIDYKLDGNSTILYVPEGIRYVRVVLITFKDSSTSQEISNLRATIQSNAADKLKEESLLKIENEAYNIYVALSGKSISFTSAIKQYNKDNYMLSNSSGYLVCEGYTGLEYDFVNAAMDLNNTGDISKLVPSDKGYYIIEYYDDLSSKEIPFESVSDEIYNLALPEYYDALWYDVVNEWAQKYGVEYFYDNVLS